MSSLLAEPASLAAPRNVIPRQAAFYLLASITVTFLAGSSSPTPLYPLYQAAWGLSSMTVTMIFGVYAIALLASLLVVGRLSDFVGRRPVLIGAALVQVATMFLFATAGGLGDLVVARVIQGIATGAAVSAVGAGMLDLDSFKGSIANAVAPALGTALGGIVAGLMVHFLPAPTHLIYMVLAAIFIMQAVGVYLMDESVSPRPGALASLKPQLSVPRPARRPLLVAIPILVAAWALAGFYASLGPAVVRTVFGWDASLYGGVALFVLTGSAAVSVMLFHSHAATRLMAGGSLGLVAGAAVAVAALHFHVASAYFFGTVLAGASFGAAFQGAVRTIVPFAKAHERAGLLSVVFVVSYLAMGLPAIMAGFAVAHGVDVLMTAQVFGGVVIALSAVALLGSVLSTQRRV